MDLLMKIIVVCRRDSRYRTVVAKSRVDRRGTPASVHDYLAAVRSREAAASRALKHQILDEPVTPRFSTEKM
jgi:hypothetical protein